MDPTGCVQLSNFELIKARNKNQKQIRFMLTLFLKFENGEDAAFGIEGCHAYYNYKGILCWKPPTSRRGWAYFQTHWMSKNFYNMILDAFQEMPILEQLQNTPLERLMKRTEMQRLPQPAVELELTTNGNS